MVLILETNIFSLFSYYILGDFMKYRYFILPAIIVCFIVLVIEYDNRDITNVEVFDDNKEIIYPFFDNDCVDRYINDYLNDYIVSGDNVLIDYDYVDVNVNGSYYLSFYRYAFDGNLIDRGVDSFFVDIKNGVVNRVDDPYFDYDFVINKSRSNGDKLVALTFDDGPNYNTNRVLDILEKYDAVGTFFVLGSRIEKNEYILKRMVNGGNEIGNHTFNHLLLTKYDDSVIRREIDDTRNLIFDVTLRYPKLLRPSYGSFNNRIKRIANCPIIIWDIDTLDWKYHNSKRISNRVVNKVRDGDIILMHDIYSATSNALEIIIPTLKDMGYTFVTVSDLFYYKGISLENGKVYGFAR